MELALALDCAAASPPLVKAVESAADRFRQFMFMAEGQRVQCEGAGLKAIIRDSHR